MKMTGKYRRKRDVAGREIAGESFLIPVCGTPVEMENVFVLNPLADFIWQRLDGTRTLAEIVAGIVAEYDVETARAESDARDFMESLVKRNLAEEVT